MASKGESESLLVERDELKALQTAQVNDIIIAPSSRLTGPFLSAARGDPAVGEDGGHRRLEHRARGEAARGHQRRDEQGRVSRRRS